MSKVVRFPAVKGGHMLVAITTLPLHQVSAIELHRPNVIAMKLAMRQCMEY
jgi:hypothetical protein